MPKCKDIAGRRPNEKHGHSHQKGCKKQTKTYSAWCSMKYRCDNPKSEYWYRYGERGITVCQRWKDSFKNFIADMGERPVGLTLERINNDLGYFKENCRWATRKEQARNTRNNRMVVFNGQEKCLSEWAESLGMNRWMIRGRLNRGWTPEEAFS